LMLNGMDVARMNFSHGDHPSHLATLKIIKKVREELNLPVAALLDTKGPEIRVCQFKDGKIELQKGQTFTLTTRDVEGTEEIVSITYKNLVNDVQIGGKILIDDGLIELSIMNKTETDIICRVMNNGFVSNNKGVNVPDCQLSMPYVSQKDYDDIVFAIENDYDFIAASFVRSAQDVLDIRKILEKHGCQSIKIISKIENMQGVQNIDEIIRVSDGIMVARGDMGVEIPFEDVPVLQKMIIQKVYEAGKVVITATQMLDSMMKNPRPTRAEATDVANAIYDGTSAIMLSGETAAGQYPIEAVQTMVKIAESAEASINYRAKFKERQTLVNPDITNAISHACCTTAMDLNASAIISVTKSGFTARMLSKYRPESPIVACVMDEKAWRQLNLSWGVTPIRIVEENNTDALFECAVDAAEQAGIVKQGEVVVITAGVPLGVSGTTNLVKVHVVGHVLIKGTSINDKIVSGNLCVCKSEGELIHNYKPGDIIVIEETNNQMMAQLRTASALIVEKDGLTSHAAVVGMSLDIPVILGAVNATQLLKQGAFVTVDGQKGIVYANK
ncbi:MAG: pyruvate kinase, partial [Coprococcus sp.]